MTQSSWPPKSEQKPDAVFSAQPTLYSKLEYYRDRLLKINSSNRSILLRGIRDKWTFDLAGTASSKGVLERALSNTKPICIVPNSDKTDQAETERRKLRRFYQNTVDIQRETGRLETYLAFIFLVGNINKSLYVRAPLILFPAFISYKDEGRPAGWYLVFTDDRDPIVNRALMERIKMEGGQPLPISFDADLDKLLENIKETWRKGNQNLESSFVEGLTAILRRQKFPINYNCQVNETQILHNISVSGGKLLVDDDKTWIDNQELHLEFFNVVGSFPQGESTIFMDYEDLMKRTKLNYGKEEFGVLEKLLPDDPAFSKLETTKEVDNDREFENLDLDDVHYKDVYSAIESDASQDIVVAASQSSECIVIGGPPGTGKSQVIVNLISNALSRGEKVLLVCQKKYALDVVYERLNSVGLARHVAPLIDGKDRARLCGTLKSILDSDPDYETASIINQKYKNCSQEIDRIIEEQKRFAHALNDEEIVGVAVSKLYVLSKPGYDSKLILGSLAKAENYHTLPNLLRKINTLEAGCKKFDTSDFPWYYRKDFSGLSFGDKNAISGAVNRVIADLSENPDPLIASSLSDQKVLVDSTETLTAEKVGLFHKLLSGGREQQAKQRIGKLLPHLDKDFARNPKELSHKVKSGYRLWNHLKDLSAFLTEEGMQNLSNELLKNDYQTFSKILFCMLQSLDYFDEIQAHDKGKAELSPKERELIKTLTVTLSANDNWSEVVKQEFFFNWINLIESKYPDLKGQPFETYMSNRKHLSELIRNHRIIAVNMILKGLNDSIIRSDATSKTNPNYRASYNQWNTLLDELNKKRLPLPLKELIGKYENILFRIAPCWLATPEAVSSVFPLNRNMFDYVIFDEASQSFVAHSLPALYRGKKIVIIGDDKQLPPVDHFVTRKSINENYQQNIDRALLSESLLALAKRAFNHRYLTWHYRSEYQELIDFSNNAFYEGSLKIAPNTTRSIVPIRWVSCKNGVWKNESNKPEAKLVVDELKNVLIKNKMNNTNLSVGIITFNYAQQEEILEEIFRRRLDDSFNELYAQADNQSDQASTYPFVRNIEKVQGDERDIIIFSLAYSKDLTNPDDMIGIQFGSLNHREGENYLNVAITRAKKEIIIICSFDPDRISADNAEYDGPRKLKQYLSYAKSISETDRERTQKILSKLRSDIPNKISLMPMEEVTLEELVKNELEKLGYLVDMYNGNSNYKIDLAVVHPDEPSKYILAIECDGKSFQSTHSVKERDITRQEFLERKGWIVERVWSRNWWRDSKKEINRLQQRIESLRKDSRELSQTVMATSINPSNKNEKITEFQSNSVEELIKMRESANIEFKSSFRYNFKLDLDNRRVLEKVIAKAIAAFMNTNGGKLFIGVDDDGNILGLEKDYSTLDKKKNSDEYEIELRQVLEKYTKDKIVNENIKVYFHKLEGKEICEVRISPSTRPIIVYDEGKQEFYVRVGNSSKPYTWAEFYEYAKRRFHQ